VWEPGDLGHRQILPSGLHGQHHLNGGKQSKSIDLDR
jgi:hypothetical protein